MISITWRESRIPDKFTQNVEVLFLLGQFTSSQSKRSTDCVSNFDPIIVDIAVCLDSRYYSLPFDSWRPILLTPAFLPQSNRICGSTHRCSCLV